MMSNTATATGPVADSDPMRPWQYLNGLSDAIIVANRDGGVIFVNLAAEQFLSASHGYIRRKGLHHFLPSDSPLFALIDQVFREGIMVSEYGVSLEAPRIGNHFVTIQVAPVPDDAEAVIVSIHEQSIARKIDHQLTHRGASRSVTAMAAMLAHEVRNPLSSIRGAAQLLEPALSEDDRNLAQLICDEADRISALVGRMDVFSDRRPIQREPVNIHQVLGHVKEVARHGFARDIRIREEYDPSLPPVYGNRDQLVQVFLNLVKNAAEAVPKEDGEIILSTGYHQGVRLAVPTSDARVDLPLVVSVQDNGPGISEELRGHLFDAFVTTKPNGSGLGLALVAKIVDDHGGVIDVSSGEGRTVFRVMLPMHRPDGDKKS